MDVELTTFLEVPIVKWHRLSHFLSSLDTIPLCPTPQELKLMDLKEIFRRQQLYKYEQVKSLSDEGWKQLDLENVPRLKILRAIPKWVMPEPRPILALNFSRGKYITGEKLLYLVRNGLDSTVKKVSESNPETDILYGEMFGDPTETYGMFLKDVCGPLLEALPHENWGMVKQENRKEFLNVVKEAGMSVMEAAQVMSEGLHLEPPKGRFSEHDIKKRHLEIMASEKDTVNEFESLLVTWCKQLNGFLVEKPVGMEERHDPGPRRQIQFWNMRVARLSAIINQLNQIPSKCVLGTLRYAGPSKALADWKNLNVRLTDAHNEAKNNAAYLSQMSKHVEVLYSGTMLEMIEALPPLLKSLRIVQEISRYYNDPEEIKMLLRRVLAQMIKNSKRCILGAERSIWKLDTRLAQSRLEYVSHIDDALEHHFSNVQAMPALNKDPSRHLGFDFEAEEVLKYFKDFSEHVKSLRSVFQHVIEYDRIQTGNCEGFEEVMEKYEVVKGKLSGRPYDMLDHTNTSIQKDIEWFQDQIKQIDAKMLDYVNSHFEVMPRTTVGLQLIRYFRRTLVRPIILEDMEEKIVVVFHNYGLDLDGVQRIYEKFKFQPPLIRDATQVSAAILWVRQLMRRIEGPIHEFKESSVVMALKESRKIIRSYNSIANALILFESMWIEGWTKAVFKWLTGLRATLLVKSPNQRDQALDSPPPSPTTAFEGGGSNLLGRLYVNLDPAVIELVEEAKGLKRLGVRIPEEVTLVVDQESRFKAHKDRLLHMIREIERIRPKQKEVLDALLDGLWEELERRIEPGLVSIMWTSLGIEEYIEHCMKLIRKIEEVIHNTDEIISNRIDPAISELETLTLTDIMENGGEPYDVDDFIIDQEQRTKEHCSAIDPNPNPNPNPNPKEHCSAIDRKSYDIEVAVKDLVKRVEDCDSQDTSSTPLRA